jgi:hypothetical protein
MLKRSDLLNSLLPKESGVYFWYVNQKGAHQLGIDINQCNKKNEHYLVYIGLAKSIHQRLTWHAFDKHTPSTIKSGFLSTLRQTLSALLVGNMNDSESTINDFMEHNMVVEFELRKDYIEYEIELINRFNLPLNLKNNKSNPFYKILKEKRKLSKLNSLKGIK